MQGLEKNQLYSLSAAYSLRALSTYDKFSTESNIDIVEVFADRNERKHQTAKLDFDPAVKQIRFQNPNKDAFFYQVCAAGFPKVPAALKQGLDIFREYAKQSVPLGEKIQVRISARMLNQLVDQAAIVDLFPAGFELVPNSIEQTAFDYVDVRDDRIIFYGTLTPEASTFQYQLRAAHKGDYVTAPIFAQAMTHSAIKAQGGPEG